MGDDVYISLGIMLLFAMCAAGSDVPWWARSLAVAYTVAAAFVIGRHVGASRIGKTD